MKSDKKGYIARKINFPFKLLKSIIHYPAAASKIKKLKIMSMEQTIDSLIENPQLSIWRW